MIEMLKKNRPLLILILAAILMIMMVYWFTEQVLTQLENSPMGIVL